MPEDVSARAARVARPAPDRNAALIAVGTTCGIAWAAGCRGYMVELAGPAATVGWWGTFGAILFPGAIVGGLLGWAEALRRAGGRRGWRWLALAPLAFAIAPQLMPGAIAALLTEGLGGAAIAVALMGIGGGYALSRRDHSGPGSSAASSVQPSSRHSPWPGPGSPAPGSPLPNPAGPGLPCWSRPSSLRLPSPRRSHTGPSMRTPNLPPARGPSARRPVPCHSPAGHSPQDTNAPAGPSAYAGGIQSWAGCRGLRHSAQTTQDTAALSGGALSPLPAPPIARRSITSARNAQPPPR